MQLFCTDFSAFISFANEAEGGYGFAFECQCIFCQSVCNEDNYKVMGWYILSSQVVSLPCKSVIQVANFCAAMDTLIDQDGVDIKHDVHIITAL